MNRITVVSCCWRRPATFRIWLESWRNLVPSPHIVVAGSPMDECADIANEFGIDYFQSINQPFGYKWNLAHKRASGSAEYYLTTGSDDVMDQKMWDYYRNFNGQRLTLSDLYFYDRTTDQALHWKGYREGMRKGWPIGAHQLTSHDAMEFINFEPFNSKSPGHEHDTLRKFERIGIGEGTVSMAETGGIGIDVKCAGSFSKFRKWPNSEVIGVNDLTKLAPELVGIIRSK